MVRLGLGLYTEKTIDKVKGDIKGGGCGCENPYKVNIGILVHIPQQ